MIEATVDDSEVQEFIGDFQAKADDLSDPLAEAGQLAVDFVRETIDEEGRGEWDPLLTPSDHPMLKDSGAMYESVGYQVRGSTVDIDDGMSYAGYQDSMRPFMFLDDSTAAEIEEILVKHFEVE